MLTPQTAPHSVARLVFTTGYRRPTSAHPLLVHDIRSLEAQKSARSNHHHLPRRTRGSVKTHLTSRATNLDAQSNSSFRADVINVAARCSARRCSANSLVKVDATDLDARRSRCTIVARVSRRRRADRGYSDSTTTLADMVEIGWSTRPARSLFASLFTPTKLRCTTGGRDEHPV